MSRSESHKLTVETISAQEMRQLEQVAIASGRVTGLELMERAGQGVVEAIFEEWPELAQGPRRAVVLCGPGNNGGDGFVVARLLRDRGLKVATFFYGDRQKLPPDARENFEIWIRDGANWPLRFPTPEHSEMDTLMRQLESAPMPDLVIDALFGIGLTRPIRGLDRVMDFNDWVCGSQTNMRCVSIDVPSGLTDDGPIENHPARVLCADLTVTFHRAKHGHQNGQDFSGKLVVKDIGL